MTSTLTGPLPPVEQIEFGKIFAPNFAIAEFKEGRWTDMRIEPLRPLEMHPAAVVFHYGQEIFEGLKAFSQDDGRIGLFRPEMNAQRFARSAERLLLPVLDEEIFIKAAMDIVAVNSDYVPERPGSLYLRPTMIGSEAHIGVRGSTEALFFLIALPAGAYFRGKMGGQQTIDVFVDESMARAARGGTGDVKAGANYAVTLRSIDKAKKLGCAQVLYLDSFNSGLIEEMGGMNIFFLLNDLLLTPALNGTILPGITRATVIDLAADLGLTVQERPVRIQELEEACKTGELKEAFACGTAATIVGINSFMFEDGNRLLVPGTKPGPMTQRLLTRIQDIQYGSIPDTHGWIHIVPTNERMISKANI